MAKKPKFANVIVDELALRAKEYVRAVAEGMTQDAKDIIIKQSYDWTPLNRRYLQEKIAKQLDWRIYYATGFYLDHIGWGMKWGLLGRKAWWGVEDVIHKPSGLRLVRIARMMEYGSGNIPPRPLWRPLLEEYKRKSPKFATYYSKKVQKTDFKTWVKKFFKPKKVKIKF